MKIKNIYFFGIKGVGMTALAIYCKQRGFAVWGGDSKESFHTDSLLEKEGIPIGLVSGNNFSDVDLIIYSGAYDINNNKKISAAVRKGIKVMSHG
ncbi:UDP-N-acetylmuramate--L-alanine ligase, partial [Candidatus Gottesmanbacteria bacterium]|nr:UDP-N-acetylmuramate--L-alanine ligase [Candidatus Gottesmanbacteria bacterium]